MTRLADYFIVIGYDHEKERSGSGVSIGKIIQRFPEKDWDDCPFIEGIELFCQPSGWSLSTSHQQPTFFVSVLTDIDAERHYCAAFTFHEPVSLATAAKVDDITEQDGAVVHRSTMLAPKSLVLVSRLNYFDTFRKCLSIIYSIYVDNIKVPLETVVGNILGCVHIPPPGGPQVRFSIGAGDRQAIQPPLSATLPCTGTSVALLFQQLGIHNCIYLFCAALTDHKLLYHSVSYTRLTQSCQATIHLLYPLKYSYVYIPILPVSLLEVLNTPTPFIAGVHSSLKHEIQDLLDVILVDLDGGSIRVPECVQVPVLPEPLLTKLKSSLSMILNPDLTHTDLAYPPTPKKPSPSIHRDKEIRAAFIRMFAELFQGYRSSLTIIRIHPNPFIAFHKANFLGYLGMADDEFLLRVLDGMCFNAFVSERGPPYRVCDIFDEVYASMPEHARDESADPSLIDRHIRDIAAQLFLNENPNPQPYVQKVPLPTEGAYSRIHQPPLPLLQESSVQDMINRGCEEYSKSKMNNVKPLQLRVVPLGSYGQGVARAQKGEDNSRRLEVLRSCVNCVFENKISDARKIFPAVLRALKSRVARRALCDELEYQIKCNHAMVEHQQFDLIVRLLNCALQNDSSMDENGIAAAILPLASTFCRKLCTGVIQFAYTCIQEHAVWSNMQFWEATFYQDVQKDIRQLYLPQYEEHSMKEQIPTHTVSLSSQKDGSLHRTQSSVRTTPAKPREITALEIAAEQLRIWSSLPESQQAEMIHNEESTVYSQAIHYANRMVYMRVPLDAQKSLKNIVGFEHESNSNSNITASLAESDSVDAESGFDETEVTEMGAGVIKFVTRFVDKVCNDSDVASDHIKALHQMIPGVVAMHIETLDAVFTESKRLPPIQKPKIMVPVLLPGEEMVMDGLRVYLLCDGRDEGTGGSMGGPALLPAEGAVFLTTYRVIFKGTPCDPLACEQIVIRCFPVSTLTKEKRLSVQYMPHLDQWLSDGVQLRSNTLQLMKVTFDEEVGSENVELFRKLTNKLRSPLSVFETFAFTGNVTLQTTQLVKQKGKNATLKQFAKRTLINTARKAGFKQSSKTTRKQKYLVPTPPIRRRVLRSESTDSDRPASEIFDDTLSIIAEGDYTYSLATDPKSLEKLFNIPGYADYKRLGLGCLPQNRNHNDPFRICVANANFSVTRSYPALVVVPQSVNDDSIRKLAQCHRQYRFPAVTWRHPRTKGLLLRASGFHSRGLMGMLKPQATAGGQSTSDLSAHTEQEKYLRAIVSITPMTQARQRSHTNSLSSADSLMMAAGVSDGMSGPGTPDSARRTGSSSKKNSLKSTMSHKTSKSDTEEQSPDPLTPSTSRRNMIRRAVESIRSSKTSSYPVRQPSIRTLRFTGQHYTLGRMSSFKDKNRMSNASLDKQLRGIQLHQSNSSAEFTSTAVPNFRNVSLYVLGEKAQMKGIKVDTYSKCEFIHIDFHDVRHVKASFKKLMRAIVPSSATASADYSYCKAIDESEWLQQVQNILLVAGATVDLLDVQGSSVMVCLEDGWDFTCQLTATAQLLLDPHYRTIEGFHALIEKEWLSFGHRFTHRSNQTTANLTSGFAPLFLQWLDVVHQILHQFPMSFEFNQTFIKFLAYHSVSNRFRTFMLDCELERMEAGWLLADKTTPKPSPSEEESRVSPKHTSNPEGTTVWEYISKHHRKSPVFTNFLYCPHLQETVLRPYSNISNLLIWDYFLSEDLAHGPLYDFEIANKEVQQAQDDDDLDGVERRRVVNVCYDNVTLRQPHIFSQLFKEIHKVQNDLGQLPVLWHKIWDSLEIQSETLKRRPSLTTQVLRTHGRSIHKRSTLEILVRGKLQGEASRTFNQPHRFEKFTFTTPSYCDHCSQMLWGLGKTGLHCTECSYNCHDKCAPSVPKTCSRVSSSLEPHASLTNLTAAGSSETSVVSGGVGLNGTSEIFDTNYSSRINEHRAQEGYLCKRGALLKGWKQRWFVLDSMKNQLRYYDSADDASCKGYIDLGDVISVQPIKNVQGAPKKSDENAFFEMKTIRRVYHFLAADSKLASDWIEKIHKYIQ